MAASDEDEYGEFEKEKPTEQVKQTTDEVKNTVKDDNKSKSVRDKAKDIKQQASESVGKGQEKLAPYFSTAKEKVEKLEGKKPEAKEMFDQAKHTVSKVVQQESKDVVEGVKRLAQDEKAFHDAAHKVADKIHHHSGGGGGGGETSTAEHERHHQEHGDPQHSQQTSQHNAHQIKDFSDFSELEEDWSDEGEGSSHHPKQHLLNHHHHPPHQPHKKKRARSDTSKPGRSLAGKTRTKRTAIIRINNRVITMVVIAVFLGL